MAPKLRSGGQLGLAAAVSACTVVPVHAQIATDGTLGPEISLGGPIIEIDEALGRRRGTNLFHSFDRFNVRDGQQVEFSGPNDLDHVISRVTGGQGTRIDGEIISSIEFADFWLINPAGILVGPDAVLSVPQGLHLSTADEVVFADGTTFGAFDLSASTLSVAAPEQFGFLGGRSGIISIDGYVESGVGSRLTIAAGEIEIDAGGQGLLSESSSGDEPRGLVRAESGRVLMTTIEAGRLSLDGEHSQKAAAGSIQLVGGGSVDTDGDGSGTILVATDRLMISNFSTITASNFGGSVAEGNVMIDARALSVADGGLIATDAFSDGSAGTIKMIAETIDIRDGGKIVSRSLDGGRAGNIDIVADALTILGGGDGDNRSILGSVVQEGAGKSGRVSLDVGSLQILDRATITTNNYAFGTSGDLEIAAGEILIDGRNQVQLTGLLSESLYGPADAGMLKVNADKIRLINGGVISTATLADGNAGGIEIVAAELTLEATNPNYASLVFSDAEEGTGSAGSISIESDVIRLGADSRISSQTYTIGNAGIIDVRAQEIYIDGRRIEGSFTGIISEAQAGSFGNAGDVFIRTGLLDLKGDSFISSSTLGEGDGGDVDIGAAILRADGLESTYITGVISTSELGATGNAGSIVVDADDIELINGGLISSSSLDRGDAGTVTVRAKHLRLQDGGDVSSTSDGVAGGRAGEVTVTADLIELRNQSTFLTNTSSAEPAGLLMVTADELSIAGGSTISSETDAAGAAGRVLISAGQLQLVDDGQIATSATGTGPAGSIEIDAQVVNAADSGIRTEAIQANGTAGQSGQGGSIMIEATSGIYLKRSIVTSNGLVPAEGASLISLQAPNIVLDGSSVLSQFADTGATEIGTEIAGIQRTGAASIRGRTTLISADSTIAASTEVTITGVDGELGAFIEIDPATIAAVEDLFGQSCQIGRSELRSSLAIRLEPTITSAPTDVLGQSGLATNGWISCANK